MAHHIEENLVLYIVDPDPKLGTIFRPESTSSACMYTWRQEQEPPYPKATEAQLALALQLI